MKEHKKYSQETSFDSGVSKGDAIRGTRGTSPGSNFIQFLGDFDKIVCWCPLLGEIMDPPLVDHHFISEYVHILHLHKGDLFLCCNICDESFMGEIMMPVVGSIKRKVNGLVTNDINHMI